MNIYQIEFKPTAVNDVKKLPAAIRKRIAQKLDYYRRQSDPLVYATKLSGFRKAGEYRFRIGQYRLVFDLTDNKIVILYVEHRREVYRKR